MAGKRPSNQKRKPTTSYMFPWLQSDISKAVSAANIRSRWINTEKDRKDSNNEYSTNVMGTFTCSNVGCPTRGWSSKTVSILIRGYPENGYNAVIFNQRCKSCNELGNLTLDKDSYVERVAYRLKKWAGVRMEQQHYAGKAGRPHMRELCEGCKRGYCRAGGTARTTNCMN
ncbi:hypothetical protein GQ53DRAFT_184749 [Thozetella sp. PMI_491]|nr:hypothetical protein GQ53DRAFT_184749 [Thozetella sp. PMI_491]